ncbi:hypothetical protein NONI108955_36360 [Nocardia ninae]
MRCSKAMQELIKGRGRASARLFDDFIQSRDLDWADDFWSERDKADFNEQVRAHLDVWEPKQAELLAAEAAFRAELSATINEAGRSRGFEAVGIEHPDDAEAVTIPDSWDDAVILLGPDGIERMLSEWDAVLGADSFPATRAWMLEHGLGCRLARDADGNLALAYVFAGKSDDDPRVVWFGYLPRNAQPAPEPLPSYWDDLPDLLRRFKAELHSGFVGGGNADGLTRELEGTPGNWISQLFD